jgi:hypothetical protein
LTTQPLTTSGPADAAYFERRKGKLALWTGVLGGPVVWAIHLQAGYAISRFSCTREHLGLLHHAVTLLMLIAAVACTLLALREWKRLSGPSESHEDEAGPLGRSQFLAGLGILTSGLFSLVIVAGWVPVFFLSPCWY